MGRRNRHHLRGILTEGCRYHSKLSLPTVKDEVFKRTSDLNIPQPYGRPKERVERVLYTLHPAETKEYDEEKDEEPPLPLSKLFSKPAASRREIPRTWPLWEEENTYQFVQQPEQLDQIEEKEPMSKNIKLRDANERVKIATLICLDRSGSMKPWALDRESLIMESQTCGERNLMINVESMPQDGSVFYTGFGSNAADEPANNHLVNGVVHPGPYLKEEVLPYIRRGVEAMDGSWSCVASTYLKSIPNAIKRLCARSGADKVNLIIYTDGVFDRPGLAGLIDALMNEPFQGGGRIADLVLSFAIMSPFNTDTKTADYLHKAYPQFVRPMVDYGIIVAPYTVSEEHTTSTTLCNTYKILPKHAFVNQPGWVTFGNVSWDKSATTREDLVKFVKSLSNQRRSKVLKSWKDPMMNMIKASPENANTGVYAFVYAVLRKFNNETQITELMSTHLNYLRTQNKLGVQAQIAHIQAMRDASFEDAAASKATLEKLTAQCTMQLVVEELHPDATVAAGSAAARDGSGALMTPFLMSLLCKSKLRIIPIIKGNRLEGVPLPRPENRELCSMAVSLMPLLWKSNEYLTDRGLAMFCIAAQTMIPETVYVIYKIIESAMLYNHVRFDEAMGIKRFVLANKKTEYEFVDTPNLYSSHVSEMYYRFFVLNKEKFNQSNELNKLFNEKIKPIRMVLSSYNAMYGVYKNPPALQIQEYNIYDGCFVLVDPLLWKESSDEGFCATWSPVPHLGYIDDNALVFINGIPAKYKECKLTSFVRKYLTPLTGGGCLDSLEYVRNIVETKIAGAGNPSTYDEMLSGIKHEISRTCIAPLSEKHNKKVEISDITGVLSQIPGFEYLKIVPNLSSSTPPRALIDKMIFARAELKSEERHANYDEVPKIIRHPNIEWALEVIRQFQAYRTPKPIQVPLMCQNCSVCSDPVDKTMRVALRCGHILCDDCYGHMIEVQQYGPRAFFNKSAHLCPECHSEWITQEHQMRPPAIAKLLKRPNMIDHSMEYRICAVARCESIAFAAGPKACAHDEETKDKFPDLCDEHRNHDPSWFHCPKCKTKFQHESGCRKMRCCPFGYHGCKNDDDDSYCSHKICGHANACGCWKGCGEVWWIGAEEVALGNQE